MEEALKNSQHYQSLSLKDIKRDRDKRNMILYAIAIDIANHIIIDRWFRKPLTYLEAFKILREAEIFSEDLAEQLVDLKQAKRLLSGKQTR